MFLSSRHEIFVLLGTFVGGLAIGGVFDGFRIFRRNFRIGASLVWLQDILMWTVILTVVYITLFITNNAELRGYEFVGFGLGVVLYMVAFSRTVIKSFTAVITFVKKILSAVVYALMFPIRLIVKPAKAISKWIKKRCRGVWRNKKRVFLRIYRNFKKI